MSHIDPNTGLVITKPTKAIVGAISAGLVAGLGAFITAVADNVITPGEWATIVIALIIGAGLTGGTVFATTNKPAE